MAVTKSGMVDGFEVWRWPEFQAFAKRLGVRLDKDIMTTGVTIRVYIDELVTVTHEYRAKTGEMETNCIEVVDRPAPVENTTVHNEQWRTYQPLSERK